MAPTPPPPPTSSILFESEDRSVAVIDVPRSIEEAQEEERAAADGPAPAPGCRRRRRRRLRSTAAPVEPFPPPPPPRDADGGTFAGPGASSSPAAQLAALTTQAAVEGALCALRAAGFDGPWCLPRQPLLHGSGAMAPSLPPPPPPPSDRDGDGDGLHIPPRAHYLAATISAGREAFLATAPPFDLIVLDPPWPNRSARRRRGHRQRQRRQDQLGAAAGARGNDRGYATAADMEALRALLEQIPVGAKLAAGRPGDPEGEEEEDQPGGLVAVWVTNKPACEALLTDPRHGVFRAWGVELVASWTWLKVTARGAPVVAVDSWWRRPWERLLLARRPGSSSSSASPGSGVRLPVHRVIVGVPDVHSRKPHLRPLLAPFLGRRRRRPSTRPLVGLEVFARNLTAGWWAWGDEVLLFQHAGWWADEDEDEGEGDQLVASNKPA